MILAGKLFGKHHYKHVNESFDECDLVSVSIIKNLTYLLKLMDLFPSPEAPSKVS